MITEKRRQQMRKANKRYNEKHPHRRAEISKKYRDNNPGKQTQAMRKWKLKKYFGITKAYYNELLQYQKGKCGICRAPMTKVAIDHSHTNGKVRGLLCNNCNVGLGMFRDDTSLLYEAITYLEGSRHHSYI